MFNLAPFARRNPFDLHKEIIRSKRDEILVRELSKINDQILKQFGTHASESKNNTLENIVSLKISPENQEKLKSLYSLKNKLIQEIRKGSYNERKEAGCNRVPILYYKLDKLNGSHNAEESFS